MEKLRIVVGGFIGLYPTGGVSWDYIQYPLGLHLLGHDVYYIEDTAQYSFYKSPGRSWDDPTDTIFYLEQTMKTFGLEHRWAYRDIATNNCYGMPLKKVLEICDTADIFINISASTQLREEYLHIPRRVLIDSDPMFTQVQDWDDLNHEASIHNIKNNFNKYTHLFSFGENIGKEDCQIPTFDLKWLTTRQPVCIDYWNGGGGHTNGKYITTVMNWSTRKKMKYMQEEWGQKDVEFEKFIHIPSLQTNSEFLIVAADNSKKMDKAKLQELRWKIKDPLEVINTTQDYKDFLSSSLCEFSVAKETYVKSFSGWFSCRSACYLAAGKPVITQETAWSKYIANGVGLMPFHDVSTALEALELVTSEITKHSKAAKDIAIEYFDSCKVLNKLIEDVQ